MALLCFTVDFPFSFYATLFVVGMFRVTSRRFLPSTVSTEAAARACRPGEQFSPPRPEFFFFIARAVARSLIFFLLVVHLRVFIMLSFVVLVVRFSPSVSMPFAFTLQPIV